MQTDLTQSRGRGRLIRFRESNILSSSFVRFLIVGAIAYAITQAVLAMFYDLLPILPAKDDRLDLGLFLLNVRLFAASAIAVECAIIFKFVANEHWTFASRLAQGWLGARLFAFNLSCLASAGVTLAAVNVLTPVFGLSPYISSSIGTLLGIAINYAISAYLIWPHRRDSSVAVS